MNLAKLTIHAIGLLIGAILCLPLACFIPELGMHLSAKCDEMAAKLRETLSERKNKQ